MLTYEQAKQLLLQKPKTWLITGVAGFIGSNLLEQLLLLNQRVIGIDNFFTGKKENLNDVASVVSQDQWANFIFYEVDITNFDGCGEIFSTEDIDYILHHAAVASVPLSIQDPKYTNLVNNDGFINILELARIKSATKKIVSIIYASSSAVYGDSNSGRDSGRDSGSVCNKLGQLLSPYAVSKYSNELYASQYALHYKLNCVGLRYFNIFGARQDPLGAYASVIPKWINSILNKQQIYINGDGTTTRDFCYVNNVVQANILACVNVNINKYNNNYNIGTGTAISLNKLFTILLEIAKQNNIEYGQEPIYKDFIVGDVKHSCADLSLAADNINYGVGVDFFKSFYNELQQVFNWSIKYNARQLPS